MTSVSTQSVHEYKNKPSIVAREAYSPAYEDPVFVHDYTERNALLADGWEPMQVERWVVHLKRLKPCDECAANDKRCMEVIKQQAEESDQRCVEMIKEHNDYMAKRYPGHTPICPT